MPPRYAVEPREPSASPVPENDAHDLLVIQDFMDTLDQIPPELTRVHSDLNELGAVLYSTLVNLEAKLNQLIDWVQDPSIEPAQRFQLLQEIAEEAARYKLGGDDKIRVAGGACDGIMSHQRHISNLLASSTLLLQGPPSPYTQSLTLQQAPAYQSSRRTVARAVNSPFGGPARAGTSGNNATTGDTPTKKKKNRIQALGADDDVSSVAGEKKKAPAKKKKGATRAASPADSLASASAFGTSKPTQPQTARQLAAAANKAKKAERADDSDDDSDEEEGPGGLGLDIGSREGSHLGGRSVNGTPVLANAVVAASAADKRRNNRGVKRARAEDEEDEESIDDQADTRPAAKRVGSGKKDVPAAEVVDMYSGGAEVADGEQDVLYCTCRQVSYGEMIGCDDDDCEFEWYHLACLGLNETPAGNWICPNCTERRRRQGTKKKPAKPKKK